MRSVAITTFEKIQINTIFENSFESRKKFQKSFREMNDIHPRIFDYQDRNQKTYYGEENILVGGQKKN